MPYYRLLKIYPLLRTDENQVCKIDHNCSFIVKKIVIYKISINFTQKIENVKLHNKRFDHYITFSVINTTLIAFVFYRMGFLFLLELATE